ncbi:MAG: peptidylprolyl isomerase [Polyangiaceae bacterium]|nr:peptidylprolyl isomerase [Polyangiaceae bacterium]
MNRFHSRTAVTLALTLSALSCEKTEEPKPEAQSQPAPAPAEPAPKPEPAPNPAAATLPSAPVNPALLKPGAATAKAPGKFKVKFTTTKGDFVVEVTRAWAPIGADRFYNLVKLGFYDSVGFFRVVPNFVVQFGIHGDPKVAAVWREARLKDDKKGKQSNDRGTVTYAKGGPDSRTTQLFINYKDNPRLDDMGFPPFGQVVQGMDVVDSINKEYEEQPDQQMIQVQGNAYLQNAFPRLDYVKAATVVK